MATTFAAAFTARPRPLMTFQEAWEETDRSRAMVAALEAECAKLAETLDALAHEYVDDPDADFPDECRVCCSEPDHVQHRTAAWVRKRYGLGAT